MGHHDDNHLPHELQDVARRLREQRPEASPLELDRIKLRAMAGARTSRAKGSAVKSRLIVALATVGLMAGGTGGVIAAKGGVPGPPNSAADSQYRPGKGCGDQNHVHTGPPGQVKKGNDKPCPPQAGPKK
jgi:hypothetical protein